MYVIIILLIVFRCFVNVKSFSSELVKNHCNKEMKENVIMMGQQVLLTDEYVIKVYRNDIEPLSNGSMYHRNERLLVSIEPLTIKQLVLEVLSENGLPYFENGKCDKRNRINSNKAILVIPSENELSSSSSSNIVINGVIAKSYATGVKLIKESFVLTHENNNNNDKNEL